MSQKNRFTFELFETNQGHYYFIKDFKFFPEGIWLPSSTTILDYFPNRGLDFWKENTSPEEIASKKIDGQDQGSKTHNCAFLMVKGETIDVAGLTEEQIEMLELKDRRLIDYLRQPLTERESKCLRGIERFWDDFEPITIANEKIVFSKKYLYAGTLDWVGYLKNPKTGEYELWIIDWKISKQHSRSYDLQVSSYYEALLEMLGQSSKAKREKLPFRKGIVYLGRGTKKNYMLKEILDSDKAFDLFLTTKKIFDDQRPEIPEVLQLPEKYQLAFKDNKFKIPKLWNRMA